MHARMYATITRSSAVALLLGLLLGAYLLLVRPAQLDWGATAEELSQSMPEDANVPHPAFNATRAITIRGRPQEIWPWLVQMGFGRAGFYGYDLIENLGSGSGIRSAQTILPAFQHPRTGDPLPLSVAATLVYGSIKPNSYLVWTAGDMPTSGVFIWKLTPLDASHTRLISRIRWNYLRSPQGITLGLFTEFADHVAVRKILEGVRDRVEGHAPQSLLAQGTEISTWLLAFVEFGAGIALIFWWRRWGRAWLLALGAGLLLMFVLYANAPVWVGAPLTWLYLALMLLCRQRERSSRGSSAGAGQAAPGT